MFEKIQKNQIIIGIAGIILIIILYLAMTEPTETEITPDVFLSKLVTSNNLNLVADLRGNTITQPNKVNIMQCMTDFSGSSALVKKNVTLYVLDNDKCYTSNLHNIGDSVELQVQDCISLIANDMQIYITQGDESNTMFYNNKMIVHITEKYQLGECSIQTITNPSLVP